MKSIEYKLANIIYLFFGVSVLRCLLFFYPTEITYKNGYFLYLFIIISSALLFDIYNSVLDNVYTVEKKILAYISSIIVINSIVKVFFTVKTINELFDERYVLLVESCIYHIILAIFMIIVKYSNYCKDWREVIGLFNKNVISSYDKMLTINKICSTLIMFLSLLYLDRIIDCDNLLIQILYILSILLLSLSSVDIFGCDFEHFSNLKIQSIIFDYFKLIVVLIIIIRAIKTL